MARVGLGIPSKRATIAINGLIRPDPQGASITRSGWMGMRLLGPCLRELRMQQRIPLPLTR